MLEQADEVQETLGRQYGMPEIDDDELAAELDALGKANKKKSAILPSRIQTLLKAYVQEAQ